MLMLIRRKPFLTSLKKSLLRKKKLILKQQIPKQRTILTRIFRKMRL